MAEDPVREEGDAVKASSHAPELAGADSEQRLVDRVRRGSESALGALFTRYASWLRRWAQGPPAGVGARRSGHERPGPGRAARHVCADLDPPVGARGGAAQLPAARRREPDRRLPAACTVPPEPGRAVERAASSLRRGGPAVAAVARQADLEALSAWPRSSDTAPPTPGRRPRRVRLQLSAARTDRAVVDAGRRAHGLPGGR